MDIVNRHLAFDGDSTSILLRFQYSCEDFISYQEAILDKYIYLGITSIKDTYENGFYHSTYLLEINWAKKFWYYANEFNRIIFDLSLNVEREVVLNYGKKKQNVEGFLVGLKLGENGKPSLFPYIYNCWHWVEFAKQALIIRDERQIQNLQQIDTETMFSKIADYRNINPDLIDPIFHDFYFQLLRKEYLMALTIVKDIIEKITTKPEIYFKNYNVLIGKKYQINYLTIPYFRCLQSVLEGNQNKFDKLLYDGLQKHRIWAEIKASKKDIPIPNSNNSSGFVSIPLLAACCLAYDNGMKINVESDYIPEWLICNEQSFV